MEYSRYIDREVATESWKVTTPPSRHLIPYMELQSPLYVSVYDAFDALENINVKLMPLQYFS